MHFILAICILKNTINSGGLRGTPGYKGGMETQTETQQLSQQILSLARQELLVKLPYLSAVLARVEFAFAPDEGTHASASAPLVTSGLALQATSSSAPLFASSAQGIVVSAPQLVARFVDEAAPPVHDVLHQLLHLVLGHYQVGPQVAAAKWNAAADVCAEFLAQALLGPRKGARGRAQQQAFSEVKGKLGLAGERLSAERLYQAFAEVGGNLDLPALQKLCFVDDHHGWYQASSESASPSGSVSAEPNQAKTAPQTQSADKNQQIDNPNPESGAGQASPQEAPPVEAKSDSATPRISQSTAPDWNKLARELMSELELQGRLASSKYAALIAELSVTQHKTRSYEDFLRSFVQVQEEPHLSDDEFDYLSYTLGLTLYGNMPLIEPLEYRTRAAIRDFVIVLDTSSSVSGAIVQQFVNTTYDILSASSAFFDSFNLHLIQCDTRVRQDTKITNLQELEAWAANVKLFGFGGTDFRPAFTYINELAAAHEFDDLAGVLYLTDGWGIYPEHMPPYKVAFVFYDEDHRPDLVPAWAEQLTINAGQFSSLSVYNRPRHVNHAEKNQRE